MSLKARLLKNSTIKDTAELGDSKFYTKQDMVPTDVPMINVALSGSLDGGLTPGITMLAGPSKHFKTAFALLLASAYLKKHPDSMMLFYDTEFGTPASYFESFDISMDRVIHTPIKDVEEMKHDIMNQINDLTRDDKVIIVFNSMGNLASKKEVDDAVEGKSVADMTRAKAFKSLFRMVTPHLSLKDIPMIVVNHTYKEIGLYPKDIVSGGTGAYYSASNIWVLGRQQEKVDKDIVGYNFIINIEKSRYVKEKSKIPISVTFDGGINKWSGMGDLAVEAGYLSKVGRSYMLAKDGVVDADGKKYSSAAVESDDEFWAMILKTTDFASWIEKRYTLGAISRMTGVEVGADE